MTDPESRILTLENKLIGLQGRIQACELYRAPLLEQQLAQSWTWGLVDQVPSHPTSCCSTVPLSLTAVASVFGTFTMTWDGISKWIGTVSYNYPGVGVCPATTVTVTFTLDTSCQLQRTYPTALRGLGSRCPDPSNTAGTITDTYSQGHLNSCPPFSLFRQTNTTSNSQIITAAGDTVSLS
jgi:hypothetical protein